MKLNDAATQRYDLLATAGLGPYTGRRLVASELIPEQQVYVFGLRLGSGDLVVGPKTFWSLKHDGAWPGLSRYCSGLIEMERDRRRRG
jgi:hypothetical protein